MQTPNNSKLSLTQTKYSFPWNLVLKYIILLLIQTDMFVKRSVKKAMFLHKKKTHWNHSQYFVSTSFELCRPLITSMFLFQAEQAVLQLVSFCNNLRSYLTHLILQNSCSRVMDIFVKKAHE